MSHLIGVSVGLVVAVTGVAARAAGEPARPATFEEAMAHAEVLRPDHGDRADLKNLVGPFFADCRRESDLETRQCQTVRDWLVQERRQATFVGFGDESALSFAPYDSSEKKIELEISGCIACGRPLKLEGDDRPHFVTTRVPKAIRGGKAVGLEVGFDDVPAADAKEAQSWQKKMASRLRVQFVFKLGPTWKSGGGDKAYEGVTFVPIAHRVIDRCTGKVIASDPPSGKSAQVAPDENCPVEPTDAQKLAAEEAGLPDQLSTLEINAAMAKLRGRVHDCANEFEVAGTAMVRLIVEKSGKIESIGIQPPFDKTPTGYCLKNALGSVSLPRFKGQKMIILYPFQLR